MAYTSKDRVRVTIITDSHHIEGEMYVLAGSRLTDALNSKAKDFLAVTNAKVKSLEGGKVLYEPDYLAVNREAIMVIFPVD